MNKKFKILNICCMVLLAGCTAPTRTQLSNMGLITPPAYKEPSTNNIAYLSINTSKSQDKILSYNTLFFTNVYDCSNPKQVSQLTKIYPVNIDSPLVKIPANSETTFRVSYYGYFEPCTFIASFIPEANQNYKLFLDINGNHCNVTVAKTNKMGSIDVNLTKRKENNSLKTMYYISSYCLPEK